MTRHFHSFEPPYYAVIFQSVRSQQDRSVAYEKMAERMEKLGSQQAGFLGIESVRNAEGVGITISYWKDMESIKAWKENEEHLQAQRLGKEKWYQEFQLRICRVESERNWNSEPQPPNL